MPGEVIKRLGVFADSWWKILTMLGAIVLFIYEGSSMWLKIEDNENELKILEERSDKRYTRGLEMYNELKIENARVEKELEDLKIEHAYEKGKNEVFRELNKKD